MKIKYKAKTKKAKNEQYIKRLHIIKIMLEQKKEMKGTLND